MQGPYKKKKLRISGWQQENIKASAGPCSTAQVAGPGSQPYVLSWRQDAGQLALLPAARVGEKQEKHHLSVQQAPTEDTGVQGTIHRAYQGQNCISRHSQVRLLLNKGVEG